MDWIRMLLSRCAAHFGRKKLDADLDDEVRAHIDLAVQENLRNGMGMSEARTEALRAFGGVTQMKEEYRVRRGLSFFESMARDLRVGMRQLVKAPGFTFTVVLTLALGIGANTAIFSVMNAVLLRMLPVRNPGQLFYVSHEHTPDVGLTGDSHYSNGINIYKRFQEATVLRSRT